MSKNTNKGLFYSFIFLFIKIDRTAIIMEMHNTEDRI